MVVLDKTRLTGWLSTKTPSKEGFFVSIFRIIDLINLYVITISLRETPEPPQDVSCCIRKDGDPMGSEAEAQLPLQQQALRSTQVGEGHSILRYNKTYHANYRTQEIFKLARAFAYL